MLETAFSSAIDANLTGCRFRFARRVVARHNQPMHRHHRRFTPREGVALSVSVLFVAACSGQVPMDGRDADVAPDAKQTADGAPTMDITRHDGRVPPAADGPCPCTPADSLNVRAEQSLECFCAEYCRDYDTALSTCPGLGTIKTVSVYADCNLEVINLRSSYEAGLSLVFDRTTHDLVGATVGWDSPVTCGDGKTRGIRAGILPPDDCAFTSTQSICDGG
jgi:hypothetical protein